ncbi:essential for maintenance of the cell wall protein 1 [Podospora conica]|nr:essential for maintenance of the cell wall protein 1 [Schizothecium conicum]
MTTPPPPSALAGLLTQGRYVDVLTTPAAGPLISDFVTSLLHRQDDTAPSTPPPSTPTALLLAQAALNAFLQATVTGPVLEGADKVAKLFSADNTTEKTLRRACLRALDVDGVSVYPLIPHVELFCFARWIILPYPRDGEAVPVAGDPASKSPAWLRVRVLSTHFKLLAQPSLGSGSVYVKAGGWSEVPGLQGEVEAGLEGVEVGGGGEERVQFLLEKANVWVMLGQEGKAREAVEAARGGSGLVFKLSGALGRRTKFQEKSTSLLVVLARSREGRGEGGVGEKPETVRLVDDTLLERLAFTGEEKGEAEADVPEELKGMDPDDQPQLAPLDQIILLTEATLKDAFSPADELTSEEILPFAVRVISDRSTNWQIYTQALLVRSRIEVHRSRTIERGILQMQAVVDQVVVDTTVEPENGTTAEADVPVIRITNGDADEAKPAPEKPTSFFPAAKPTESAPAQVRLQYLHALSTPPRWHLESELAFSWASVGSLVSAVDIFKRLRLWAEVALCMASHAANNDEDGRGSGEEERAKAIIRWRLFRRTGTADDQQQAEDEDEDVDINEIKLADFQGPERSPPPHNAPRLYCILGDMENEPKYYERAWEISKHRFSRAQKSLGEYYLQQKDLPGAKAAYEKAITVNRMSAEMWSRLGDISLRMGDFSDAADAFGRAIACADSISGGDDARTWSNLGTALYSLYVERAKEVKQEQEQKKLSASDDAQPPADDDDEEPSSSPAPSTKKDPATLLSQSLAAFKRGASISHDNWRIWDNVITLAARLRPVAVPDILLALRNVIRIRNSEDCLDVEILRLLLNDAVLSQPKADAGNGVYDPPRGSPERAVVEVLETLVVPLITVRSELWELVARERVWKRDYAGAVDAAERAWRAAVGAAAGGGLMPVVGGGGEGKRKNWLEDEAEWGVVVERTDELVSILENYGGEVPEIGARWKGKARSAVRSVLGKAKESWEGSGGWERLKGLLEGLK